jgi:hypothetical protein
MGYCSKGVSIRAPILDCEAGRFVHFDDRDGNAIYFWEVNRAEILESQLAETLLLQR